MSLQTITIPKDAHPALPNSFSVDFHWGKNGLNILSLTDAPFTMNEVLHENHTTGAKYYFKYLIDDFIQGVSELGEIS